MGKKHCSRGRKYYNITPGCILVTFAILLKGLLQRRK